MGRGRMRIHTSATVLIRTRSSPLRSRARFSESHTTHTVLLMLENKNLKCNVTKTIFSFTGLTVCFFFTICFGDLFDSVQV